MTRLLSWFVTWWGALILGFLDASIIFFLPFGIDAVVVYLVSRDPDRVWVYPVLATAGSVAGAGVTFWIGRKAGEQGLERFVPHRRLERLRCRVRDHGAVAIAVPAVLPPPFPLTPFVLTCGALKVNPWRFFATFAVGRLARFGTEAALAVMYGAAVLRVMQSDTSRFVIVGFIALAVTGTAVSGWMLWRSGVVLASPGTHAKCPRS
jgi:membrane protein YqaA with SNARE-associated domain